MTSRTGATVASATAPVPARTAQQRADALTVALAARRERARVRAAIQAGELTVADVLGGADDNPAWSAFPVRWLLECIPGVGEVRSAQLMSAARVARTRRVRGLGVRQRTVLLQALAQRA